MWASTLFPRLRFCRLSGLRSTLAWTGLRLAGRTNTCRVPPSTWRLAPEADTAPRMVRAAAKRSSHRPTF
ncbi:MAG: hypothetical protein C4315_11480 [Chloroflexota bacterium]